MDTLEICNQIKKLLGKLIFDKKGIEIDVEPFSRENKKHYDFVGWKKYIVTVHVNPYKFNDVNDEFDEDYYNFMTDVDDLVSKNIKYLGLSNSDVGVIFTIDNKEKFISDFKKLTYENWPNVMKEFQIDSGSLIEPELRDVDIYQKGYTYPEFQIYFDTVISDYKAKPNIFEPKRKSLWNSVHEILPVGQMFVEID